MVQQSAFVFGSVSFIYAVPLTILASQLFRFKYKRIKYNSLGASIGVYLSELAMATLVIITIYSSWQTSCGWNRYEPCNQSLLFGGGLVVLAFFSAGSFLNYSYYKKRLTEWK